MKWSSYRLQTVALVSKPLTLIAVAAALMLADRATAQQPAVGGATALVGQSPIAIDIDKFADKVEQSLDGNTVGWQFAIFKNGKLVANRAGGKARTVGNAPARGMNKSDRMEIASCSKTLNAIATISLLKSKGISLDASVVPYLPPSWTVHPSMNKVTFKRLMQHRSGLKKTPELAKIKDGKPGWHTRYMKAVIRGGQVNPAMPKDYENTNTAVCRLALAYIVAKNSLKPLENNDAKHELAVGRRYAKIVRHRVFKPAGLGLKIFPFDWHPSGSDYPFVRYYKFSNPSSKGIENAHGLAGVGAGGWTMSAKQLAQVMSAWENGKLLSTSQRKQMKSENLGIGDSSTAHGTAYTHNGGFSKGGKGGGSRLVAFPGNVQAALIVNSKGSNIENTFHLLRKAYESARKQSDLIVTSFKRTGAPTHKAGFWRIPVKMTVKNKGDSGTGIPFFNAVSSRNNFRWVGQMTVLGSGKSKQVTGVVKIKDQVKKLKGRTIKLVASADARIAAADTSIPAWARIKESNESNNSRQIKVKVPGQLGLSGSPQESVRRGAPKAARSMVQRTATAKSIP